LPHSQALAFPIMPNLGRPLPPFTTSGVKNPPPPFASGLSCLRLGMRPGISEAELLGMGFGDSVGGRDVRDEEDRAGADGSANRRSGEGAEPGS